MNSESTPTIKISERTIVSTPLVLLLGGLGPIIGFVVLWTTLRGDVSSHSSRLDEHEKRIQRIEERLTDIAVIKNDVAWMRSIMEQQKSGPKVP